MGAVDKEVITEAEAEIEGGVAGEEGEVVDGDEVLEQRMQRILQIAAPQRNLREINPCSFTNRLFLAVG